MVFIKEIIAWVIILCLGNNRIDHDEFVGVVQSRTFYGSAEVI